MTADGKIMELSTPSSGDAISLHVYFHILYRYNAYIQKVFLGWMVGVVLVRVCGLKFGWGLVLHQLPLQFVGSSVTLMLWGC